jgi:predicted transposase YdaD
MGFTYNIKKDDLYQEGKKANQEELIVELLKDGTLGVEKIAALTKVPVERVKQLAKDLKG